jgi:hypothetical protein
MTPMASRRDVIQETNARYWVGTGYKLGEALNPKDPTDRMHAKRWLDTYRDLMHQNARGTLTLLHKDPSFAQSLDNAINAYRIERQTREGDARYAEARRAKQQALNDAGLWQEMIMARGSAVSGWEVMLGASADVTAASAYEVERLHNSWMLFGQEVARKVAVATSHIQDAPEHKRIREDMMAAFKRVETLPRGTQQRSAAVNDARRLQEAVADDFKRRASTYPIIAWERTIWEPNRMAWLRWKELLEDFLRRDPNTNLTELIETIRSEFIKVQNSMPY